MILGNFTGAKTYLWDRKTFFYVENSLVQISGDGPQHDQIVIALMRQAPFEHPRMPF